MDGDTLGRVMGEAMGAPFGPIWAGGALAGDLRRALTLGAEAVRDAVLAEERARVAASLVRIKDQPDDDDYLGSVFRESLLTPSGWLAEVLRAVADQGTESARWRTVHTALVALEQALTPPDQV